jgi:hypothetical protein
LQQTRPERAQMLLEESRKNVKRQWDMYKQLAEQRVL